MFWQPNGGHFSITFESKINSLITDSILFCNYFPNFSCRCLATKSAPSYPLWKNIAYCLKGASVISSSSHLIFNSICQTCRLACIFMWSQNSWENKFQMFGWRITAILCSHIICNVVLGCCPCGVTLVRSYLLLLTLIHTFFRSIFCFFAHYGF